MTHQRQTMKSVLSEIVGWVDEDFILGNAAVHRVFCALCRGTDNVPD